MTAADTLPGVRFPAAGAGGVTLMANRKVNRSEVLPPLYISSRLMAAVKLQERRIDLNGNKVGRWEVQS